MVLFGGSFFTGHGNRRRSVSNMDTLVALSTSIAFLFSLFNTFFRSSGQIADWNRTSITKLPQ